MTYNTCLSNCFLESGNGAIAEIAQSMIKANGEIKMLNKINLNRRKAKQKLKKKKKREKLLIPHRKKSLYP